MLSISCTWEAIVGSLYNSKKALSYLRLLSSQVHKWESNVKSLESESMPKSRTILGQPSNKDDDTLELSANSFLQEKPVTKRTILSYLGTVYNPLGRKAHLSKSLSQDEGLERRSLQSFDGPMTSLDKAT